MKTLRRTFISDKPDRRPRIEVLDRLSLGGKKSLLLIAIEQRRLLIGVGEGAVPSILSMEDRRQISPSTLVAVRNGVALRKRKRVH